MECVVGKYIVLMKDTNGKSKVDKVGQDPIETTQQRRVSNVNEYEIGKLFVICY